MSITVTTVSGVQYSGIWTLDQATNAIAAGTWPVILKPKLFSFGQNSYGQLGQSNVIDLSSPVQVGTDFNWSNISAKSQIAVATKDDGTLWGWGRNDWGQIGNESRVELSSPVQVGALTTWSKVAANQWACFFIKTNGELWVSGRNVDGCMGLNQDAFLSIYAISSPVQVGSQTWSSITTAAAGVDPFVLAIRTNGTLWAWGNNAKGQLGDGTVQYRSSPVQVGALTTWSKVSCGTYHTIAVKTDGTLWTWGGNQYGQLGIGVAVAGTSYRSSPVQVGALTTWSNPTGGNLFSAATTTSGTLWAWGENSQGQLGQNNTIYRSSPVQVGALTTWSSISGSGGSLYSIKTDGTLWAWGSNNDGQLGQGNIVNKSSPVQIGTSTSWINVSATESWAIATKS